MINMSKTITILTAMAALLVFSNMASAFNHFSPEELLYAVDTPQGKALPILVEDNLLIASTFHLDGEVHTLPTSVQGQEPGKQHTIQITTAIEVSTNTLAFISLSGGEGQMAIPVEASEHQGLLEASLTDKGGHVLLLPLVNWPEGTNGYVVPLIEYENNLVIPLLFGPRGHFVEKNKHSINPWGFTVDLTVGLEYY